MTEDPKNVESPLEEHTDPSPENPEITFVAPEESVPTDPAATNDAENEAIASDSEEVLADQGVEEPLDADQLEGVVATLQQEISNLRQQLNTSTQQAETVKAQYVRIAADFENFRKRTEKDKEDMELRIKCNTITELLGAIDNFERARLQIKPANDGEMAIHKSYQGVYKQIVDALKKIGVSAMRPEGQEFDPNFHEAIFQEPTSEFPEGTVIEQIVRGYLLGDKVLRHAMVKVAAAPTEESLDNTQQEINSNG